MFDAEAIKNAIEMINEEHGTIIFIQHEKYALYIIYIVGE